MEEVNEWKFIRNEKGQILNGFGPYRCPNSRTDYKKKGFYMDLFNWLKEHLTEPMLVSNNEEDEPIVNIWYTILNHDPTMFDPNSGYAKEFSNNFMKVAASYIPEFKDQKDMLYVHRWDDHETRAEFCEWFCRVKAMLENYMAKEYFMKGKMKDNEILKRRFKRTWSESRIIDAKVEADQNIKSDNKIEIKISDA